MFASTLPAIFIKNRPELQKFILDKNYNNVNWSDLRLSVYVMNEGLDGCIVVVASNSSNIKEHDNIKCDMEFINNYMN